MDSSSVNFIAPIARHARDTPSRYEMALGVIRGGAVPWSSLLPLMVRSDHSLNSKLSPRLAGTNVRSLVSAWHYSSRRPLYQVHLVVCSL